METLAYIGEKYGLNLNGRCPIEIRNRGRDDLPELFHELGFTVGAEIGVERGVYSEILCQGAPELHLYCIDAWRAYQGYRDHVSQEKMDGMYLTTQERLRPYDCELIRAFSVDAAENFADGSLDFVYIDGNHEFPYIVQDLLTWPAKVRAGGIVAGHDYIGSTVRHSRNHVMYVVDAFVRAYKVRPWFLLGAKEKREGEVRDKARSWFWIKADD